MKEILVAVQNNCGAIQELQQTIELLLGVGNSEQSTPPPRAETPPELPFLSQLPPVTSSVVQSPQGANQPLNLASIPSSLSASPDTAPNVPAFNCSTTYLMTIKMQSCSRQNFLLVW